MLLVDINGEWIAHRLLTRRSLDGQVFIITRGDNSACPDQPVSPDAVLGKVTGISRNGREIPVSGEVPGLNRDEALLLASFKCPGMPLGGINITPGFPWKTFVESAVTEGLAPLLCENNREMISDDRIPAEWAARLEKERLSSLARTVLFQQELNTVATILSGIDFIPLKGAYLAGQVYASPALRPFSDIDILVKRTDFKTAAGRLIQAGFTQESRVDLSSGMPPFSPYLNSAVFRKNQGGPDIHVHWHLLNSIRPLFLSINMDMDDIWKSARKNTGSFMELSPEHLIIHLAEHAVRHSFDRLILIRDIAEVLDKFSAIIDWEKLTSDCRTFNLQRIVYYSLLLTARKTAVQIPVTALEALMTQAPGLCERLFLKLANGGARHSELGSLLYISNSVSWKEKARLVLQMVFPPRSVLAYAYNREAGSIGLGVYISRLVRGLRSLSLAAGQFLKARKQGT